MYKFNTKYKSCLSATDELQYIRQGDSPPSLSQDDAPKRKQANYDFSIVSPVSGGKSIPMQTAQLTGKGVSAKAKIYNEYEACDHSYVESYNVFCRIDKFSRRRLFKKDNVIYDLNF
jgi:hypothetical protein